MADMEDVEKIAAQFRPDGIDSASITVLEGQFQLEELPGITIRFRIKRILVPQLQAHNRYRFELSHYIHTPEQAGPYIPSGPYYPTVDDAAEKAIYFTIVDWYKEAITKGHTPDESWLVPNSTWND